MKPLLNTLFVTSEDVYLSLDGENIVVSREKECIARYPLHTLCNIVSFSYAGASPALMGACVERDVGMALLSPRGKFLARITGKNNGNVLLRRTQYRLADNTAESCRIARTMIFGKLHNSRWSIERTLRDHALSVDSQRLKAVSVRINELLPLVINEITLDSLRGLEGTGAGLYFSVLDEMVLKHKETFSFQGRSRRPPLDPLNAMLSFAYSLLAHDCACALESAGLDSYVGFLHRDRPGRSSLALDIMEELRPCIADRFVLTMINNRIISPEDFEIKESGAVFLSEQARRTFLKHWQEKKKDTMTHPYLNEKMQWGVVPYVQALLLCRYLREDLDSYPPFLWK